ncbi:D-alanine-D-alanine ligase [Peptoclostridium litorale DSM 5388]|uniref:D-alanine--D-alanine ligase n=2 Tax=Peptoclostridium litorale TaxID=1557 RepID=A0A069RCX3_PEPLI|nr:D-alanine--D-alanine ligase Ddl [Peptoclostridium litorale DSM 5388]SIN95555.1 D-alanine-D-alanine ligase [Peptoclostridium litorale DSM 5388]
MNYIKMYPAKMWKEGVRVNKMNVAVLFGGKSGEHEVSLESAASICRAMDKDKYNIYMIGITKNGEWAYCKCTPDDMESGKWLQFEVEGSNINLIPSQSRPAGIELESGEIIKIDACFPVIHGPFGEDGTLQGIFEMASIPYVGCKVLSSSLAMDKAMFKKVMDFEGIPQVDYVSVRAYEFEKKEEDVIKMVEDMLDYPVFTKPANMGSSVGISKASDAYELASGIREALKHDSKVVIEQGINAREIEVAVLGSETVRASVPGEVLSCKDFYDYEAKYLANSSKTLIPAQLDEDVKCEIQDMAIKAFKAIDGEGISRIDFFIEKDTNRVYINEINTMPGFTKISMYPKLWDASGMPYTKLIDELIRLAIKK